MITDPGDGIHQRNMVDMVTEGHHIVVIVHLDAVFCGVTEMIKDDCRKATFQNISQKIFFLGNPSLPPFWEKTRQGSFPPGDV